ncbi:non-ribosomal peptide synthetase [Longispora albida]|uniref:non-ribosomal peptide synthetase n=1 Tax=Longispora albida TaxID=203523 RepID=UPI000371E307|nr:non-ribosomal peptide synthetase [Longispora albida]
MPPEITDTTGTLLFGQPLPSTGQRPVHEQVAAIAQAAPDQIALHADGTGVTYAGLHDQASRIAARLAAAGAGPGSRVGVLAGPCAGMVPAVLGVLQAGAAYVPVDPAQPAERIARLLGGAGLSAVLTAGPAEAPAGLSVPVLRAEDPFPGRPTSSVQVSPSDAAYLIHTSGSTGEPKAVLVGHGQLTASTQARQLVYPGQAVFLLVSPLAFDSSVAGLWGTLTTGGRLVVASADEVRDPARLADLIAAQQVTRLLCIPSLYSVLLDAAERAGLGVLGSLDTVIVAGEPLPQALADRHFALRPGTVLVNEYGPTEATVWASYQRFEHAAPVTVGAPVPGVNLYVLGEDLQPVPRGTAGELFIGGAGVSCGYAGDPEATSRAFLSDPFAPGPAHRMYRSGDLVRCTPEGTLEFLGRRDQQVKIRGHRIELGAVEAALRTVPGVEDAVVLANPGLTQLTAFVVGRPELTAADVRDAAARMLPEVSVPRQVRILGAFPLTTNGKADRLQLAALAETPAGEPAAGQVTGTDLTAKVTAAWAEVLKTTDIPAEVNFFDLGGHSLTMFQLQDALEKHTGIRPPVVALFQHTTVAAQAAMLSDVTQESDLSRRNRRIAARRARAGQSDQGNPA